ncbi:alpha/beta hydrolase [Galbitalea sp. SE-J8]|uniref:alpha/beta hydrolase n=1 Tax=Galbitalea sp. SE-J8 TaxID=3054952 RepID=UPI00259C885F|nr:alpha/beta hydrolase [Galbitalea sp. SE-J8]MDM4761764.1 alpha/beta hydrolase [Galbitalea sp. SE-J8]
MTTVLLIPGFWLDASSWDGVASALRSAGHDVRALTLPGLASRDADRADIGFADHVAAVLDAIDATEGPVVLVGHSGGGAIASVAADARVDRIARVVYVDAGPIGDGGSINPTLPVVDGEIPFPGVDSDEFAPEEVADLTPEHVALLTDGPAEPRGVAYDEARLSDERRYGIPQTMIASTMTADVIEQLIADGHPYTAEFARMTDREIVELPAGHWPQLTRPAELASAIAGAIG